MNYKVIRQKPIVVDQCYSCPFMLTKKDIWRTEHYYCKLAMNVNKKESCEIVPVNQIPSWCMLEDWKPKVIR
jgi:hypothetical protein